jgi:hypothetical protein
MNPDRDGDSADATTGPQGPEASRIWASHRVLLVGRQAGDTEGVRARRFPRRVLWRGVRVALVVGTILTAANQGDRLLADQIHGWDWLRVVANYLVPFLVASYSGWKAAMGHGGRRATDL